MPYRPALLLLVLGVCHVHAEGAVAIAPDGTKMTIVEYIDYHTMPIDDLTAHAKRGVVEAQYELGRRHIYGTGVPQDASLAIRWLKPAALAGHVHAMVDMGDLHYYGALLIADYIEAVKWYRMAAKRGHSSSEFNLGECYELGRGVGQSAGTAIKWYTKASKQGGSSCIALVALAKLHAAGIGIAKDEAKAAGYYRQAADYGFTEAQAALGLWYEQGIGVAKDPVQACVWYALAGADPSEKGQKAKEAYTTLRATLTLDEQTTIERRVAAWKMKPAPE